MLVLTRRRNEAIVIGDGDVRFRILSVSDRGEVRVGIEADKAISIHREEIYAKVKREEAANTANRQAVESVVSEAS